MPNTPFSLNQMSHTKDKCTCLEQEGYRISNQILVFENNINVCPILKQTSSLV
jgi:hypothetical protein